MSFKFDIVQEGARAVMRGDITHAELQQQMLAIMKGELMTKVVIKGDHSFNITIDANPPIHGELEAEVTVTMVKGEANLVSKLEEHLKDKSITDVADGSIAKTDKKKGWNL